MSKIIVIKRDGSRVSVDSENGASLMISIRNSGIDELVAICGGSCSCATCHLYVSPEHYAILPKIAAYELDLLDCLKYRRETSRLSCQINFEDALNDMVVEIAPEE